MMKEIQKLKLISRRLTDKINKFQIETSFCKNSQIV